MCSFVDAIVINMSVERVEDIRYVVHAELPEATLTGQNTYYAQMLDSIARVKILRTIYSSVLLLSLTVRVSQIAHVGDKGKLTLNGLVYSGIVPSGLATSSAYSDRDILPNLRISSLGVGVLVHDQFNIDISNYENDLALNARRDAKPQFLVILNGIEGEKKCKVVAVEFIARVQCSGSAA